MPRQLPSNESIVRCCGTVVGAREVLCVSPYALLVLVAQIDVTVKVEHWQIS